MFYLVFRVTQEKFIDWLWYKSVQNLSEGQCVNMRHEFYKNQYRSQDPMNQLLKNK